MPSFSVTRPNLQRAGPLCEVQIAVGAAVERVLNAAHKPIPLPATSLALVDTGAARTVIRTGIAARLGLNPVGVAYIHTPSSSHVRCGEFLVRILFPNNILFETTVIEAPLHGQQIDCLVGRDVLAHAVLVYVGYLNQFTLSV